MMPKAPTISAILLLATAASASAQSTPPPYSDDLLAKGKASNPAQGYANDFGVSVAEANDRLALQQQASAYAQSLLESSQPGFVSLTIRHTPNFKITVFYEKGADHAGMMRAAPVEIRKYLVFNPFNKSRAKVDQDRDAIINPLRAVGLRFGLEYDYESDRYGLEIPEASDRSKYVAAIPLSLLANVDIRTNTVAVDAAAAYGGLYYTTGSANCTSGWPIRNSSAAEGILTAGHCLPPESMGFSGGPTLTTVSFKNTPAEVATYDYAMFNLGTNTTTRVIYVANDNITNVDGTSNYISGFTSAYYEIAAPLAFAVGQYVCKQGFKTRLTCGTVIDTNWSDSGGSGVVKVSKSAQGNIADSGDSGGPVFMWTTSNSQVRPVGIMKGANVAGSVPCKNTSTVVANNTSCYFTVMPLKKISGRSPFTVNTFSGFAVP
jgi:hypothetical protein